MGIKEIQTNRDKLVSLYDEYYDKIANYIYSRIGNKTEAEDLASEVFLKALEAIKTYDERGLPMQAWLFKIAHNVVVDHLRKITKYKTISIDKVEIRSEDDPQKTAEINIEMERVMAAMQQLTDEQQEVIRLHFLAGLSSLEVSALLKKTMERYGKCNMLLLRSYGDCLVETCPGN
jgi:RNA polymerase sigma-70 factor (ECF subfamily)